MAKKFEVYCYPDGKTDVFTTSINLKNFLKELADVLHEENFHDVVKANGHAKKGEFVPTKENRTGNMYETRFQWIQEGSIINFETAWEAKRDTPHSKFGSVYFKLDLVCRNMKDIEILDGNNKKVLQKATWEFRNKFIYTNSIYQELEKSWIYQTFPSLKDIYVNHMYKKNLDADLEFCFSKVVPLIYGVINKHMSDQ